MAVTETGSAVLVDPVQASPVTGSELAKRSPAALTRPWGFVDTSKVNAAEFIEELSRLAQEEFGVDSIVIHKDAPGVGITDEQASQLADKCGVVVAAFGDCGTSTSFGVRDAVEMERLGIPSVAVCSKPFVASAADVADVHGYAFLPIASVPHPMARLTRDELRAEAAKAYPAIREALIKNSEMVDEFVAPTAEQGTPQPLEKLTTLSRNTALSEGIFEELYASGWSDGLPIVPPTRALVDEMLAASSRSPESEIGPVPPRQRKASLRKVAANAVMAGCRPEYFPVVLAALDAVLDPASGLYSSQTATNTSGPLFWVNGPIAGQLGMAKDYNCLGPDSRANATIGRAVRLVLRNIGGELPGITDVATHGSPSKFTYMFAENEASSPWAPWHVSQGYSAGQSTITTIMASPPQNIFAYGCDTAEELLGQITGAMTGLGHNNILFDPGPVIIFSPEHAHMLAREGLDRADIQRRLFEDARIPLTRFPATALVGLRTRRKRWFETVGDKTAIGVADSPSQIYITVAGGPGIHTQFISTAFSLRPVTRTID
jgi:hypothetical protein